MKNVIEEHYRRLGKDYDRFLYYSPEFVRTLTRKMIEMLAIHPDDRLVDLGCGTAMYSIDMCKQVPLKRAILAVDPFQEMLDNIPAEANVEPLCLDALEFSVLDYTYNKILIKEAVHHVDDKPLLFQNLHNRLPEGGRILLVHVPPTIQYPLFQSALDRARHWHADPDALVRILADTGFRVERDAVDYPHALPKDHYFNMVRSQYMTVLSSFSDEEIAAGLEEMAATYSGETELRFTDHFDYILAEK